MPQISLEYTSSLGDEVPESLVPRLHRILAAIAGVAARRHRRQEPQVHGARDADYEVQDVPFAPEVAPDGQSPDL